jgi:hypothetical protein
MPKAVTPTIESHKPKVPYSRDLAVVTPPANGGAVEKTDYAFNVSARDLQLVLSSSPSPRDSILKKPAPPRPKALASALISVDSDSSDD